MLFRNVVIAIACTIISMSAFAFKEKNRAEQIDKKLEKVGPFPEGMPTRVRYSSNVNCDYEIFWLSNGKQPRRETFVVSTLASKDKIIVTHHEDNQKSSLLIDEYGRIHNFNITGADQDRWTPETLSEKEKKSRAELGQRFAWTNRLSIFHPPFTNPSTSVGNISAVISDSKGREVMQFVYLGRARVSGRDTYVFDIVNRMVDSRAVTGSILGRSIIDQKTGMPIYLALGGSFGYRAAQLSCR